MVIVLLDQSLQTGCNSSVGGQQMLWDEHRQKDFIPLSCQRRRWKLVWLFLLQSFHCCCSPVWASVWRLQPHSPLYPPLKRRQSCHNQVQTWQKIFRRLNFKRVWRKRNEVCFTLKTSDPPISPLQQSKQVCSVNHNLFLLDSQLQITQAVIY